MNFDAAKVVPLVVGLSLRQRQVLIQMGRCRSEKEIAETLKISQMTVHSHKQDLYQRLGIRDKAEAALVAREAKLV